MNILESVSLSLRENIILRGILHLICTLGITAADNWPGICPLLSLDCRRSVQLRTKCPKFLRGSPDFIPIAYPLFESPLLRLRICTFVFRFRTTARTSTVTSNNLIGQLLPRTYKNICILRMFSISLGNCTSQMKNFLVGEHDLADVMLSIAGFLSQCRTGT